MLHRVVLIALAALVMVSSSVAALGTAGAAPAKARSSGADCVLIDTDFDIDDMMAIPLVIGNRPVAGIITSEGYTKPRGGAAALSRLVAEPGQRNIPIIVGASSHRSTSSIRHQWGQFVLDYRAMMNRLNDFLPVPLRLARPERPQYERRVAHAVAGCRSIDIEIIGTFTSFIHYSPRIRSKINKVVIMGKPLRGDQSQRPGNFSFNCEYDMPACKLAFNRQLPGLRYAYVDVPRTHCDETPSASGCAGKVYGPTLSMVEHLRNPGLPHTLKQVLLNHPSSWAIDRWEESGFGGKSLLWDQSASLYLLKPDSFHKVGGGGGHYETTRSPAAFRHQWTRLTDRAVRYRTSRALR